jgi:hypothetical protein
MSTIKPHDPFGIAEKIRSTMTSVQPAVVAAEPASNEAASATEAKPKRQYVGRGRVIPDTVSGDQDEGLVIGYFSNGGLSIRKGKEIMTLTPAERAERAAFLEKVE